MDKQQNQYRRSKNRQTVDAESQPNEVFKQNACHTGAHNIAQVKTQVGQRIGLFPLGGGGIIRIQRIVGGDPQNKVYKLTSFSGKSGDIADPWYTGNFDETYENVLDGCKGFLQTLLESGELYRK